MYSCSSSTEGVGGDLENLGASSSIQASFDMQVLGAHESDNLDVVATNEQHSKTAFRSYVPIEPPERGPRQLRIHHEC